MARLGRTYTRLVRRTRPAGGVPPRVKPTLVSSTSTAWNTATSPKTLAISWQTGDVVVVGAMSSDDSIAEFGDVTVTGLAFTISEDIRTGSRALLKVWTAIAGSSGSGDLSLSKVSNPNSAPWGFHAFVFRGSDGVGSQESTNAASSIPLLPINTTNAHSAIVVFNADWAAVSGSSRLWRTVEGPNLLTANQASLETDLTGWENQQACTPARSTAQALDGSASLEMTSTSGTFPPIARTPIGTSGVPVVGSASYSFMAYFRPDSTVRDPQVGVVWFDSSGAQISLAYVTAGTEVTSAWFKGVTTTGVVAAPSNAAYASVRTIINAANVVGEKHYVDQIAMMRGYREDWAVGGGTGGITPTSGNGLERDYFNSANYTTYVAYYDDVVAARTNYVGLDLPDGQTYSIAAVEVYGANYVEAPPTWTETWGLVQM